MSALDVAEAALSAAQDVLDVDPDSRPAQVDYEAKLSDWEALSSLTAAADPADDSDKSGDAPIYDELAAEQA